MKKQKTLILIDGHALAFRQYYALERTNMQTSDGVQTWAVFGFFKAIFDLMANEKIHADSIAVTFDVGRQTFRTEKFVEYKANRSAMPDPLRSQLGYICEGLKAFNIPIYTKEGFEADDVIGTITKKATENGHKTYILTGDQDSFQLIDKEGTVCVLIPYNGKLLEYDWDKVFTKLGVYPNQVIDYKALRGDTADNIPGVKGIGEKTAQKLLAEYQNLDNVLANCENLTPNSVKTKICEGVDIAKLSYELATIIRDVDIDFDFESANIELPEMDNVLAFLKKYQLNSFLKNIDKIVTTFNKGETPVVSAAPQEEVKQVEQTLGVDDGNPLQLGLFSTAVIEKNNKASFSKTVLTENFDELIEKISANKVFALDVVANVENAVNSEIVGFAIAVNKDNVETYYIPYSETVLEKFKPIFENEHIKKVTQNGKDAINTLRLKKIDLKGITVDVNVASYIKNPSNKHDIDVQALNYLDFIMQNMPDVVQVKKGVLDFKRASDYELSEYFGDVAYCILKLADYWENNLDESELKLLNSMEIPLMYVLSDMEFLGVSVDKDYLISLSDDLTQQIKDLEQKIFELAGMEFNIASPKQVSEVLFDKLQLKLAGKKNKKLSTSAEVLEELAEEYDICKYLLEFRRFSKLKSTYTDSLPELISKFDDRIHTTYNQTITNTGRLSSSNPNLQNIPIRTKEGNKLRAAFVPKDRNNFILSADYSQIELRLLAHVSGDENLIAAFNSHIDVHTLTASKVFEVTPEEVTKDMRYKAKAVNFGTIYGQTRYGLAKMLGISPFEAQDFIDKYFITYPKVKDYMDLTVDFALENGFVKTIFGRKRYMQNELTSPNRMIQEFGKRAAINQPLQGTAADLIKLAMLETEKNLKLNNLKSKMIMQVHDELVLEVYADELEQVKDLVVKSMQLNQPFKVPLDVDVNWSKTWQE